VRSHCALPLLLIDVLPEWVFPSTRQRRRASPSPTRLSPPNHRAPFVTSLHTTEHILPAKDQVLLTHHGRLATRLGIPTSDDHVCQSDRPFSITLIPGSSRGKKNPTSEAAPTCDPQARPFGFTRRRSSGLGWNNWKLQKPWSPQYSTPGLVHLNFGSLPPPLVPPP
jgi:hypothetical protein